MAKRKIRKFLKKAAPLLAIAGLGKAFMNARNLRNQNKTFLAEEGGDRANMFPASLINEFGMANKPRVKAPRKMPVNPASFLSGIGDDPLFPDIPAGAKSGGVIVKTETGGKAVRRKKKKPIQIRGYGKARR